MTKDCVALSGRSFQGLVVPHGAPALRGEGRRFCFGVSSIDLNVFAPLSASFAAFFAAFMAALIIAFFSVIRLLRESVGPTKLGYDAHGLSIRDIAQFGLECCHLPVRAASGRLDWLNLNRL
jgi:hypothetical protein